MLECLKTLRIPLMDERRRLIEAPEPHTFDWIFQETRTGFIEWLIGNGPMFWIKGKPGSGKSSLMKYLVDNPRTIDCLKSERTAKVTTAGFYFYDQGSHKLHKSLDGLLIGVLYQVLSAIPELFAAIEDVYESVRNAEGWNRTELTKAFVALAQQDKISGCVCIFIDALDEYDGNPTDIVRGIVRLLKLFGKNALKIKICASSRPLPEFEAMLDDSPGFAIHDWTSNDVRQVVAQRLTEAKREPMPLLSSSIVDEAKGVFLWVKLILEELSPCIFDGYSEDDLISKLSALPKDLEPFYDHMLQRISPAIRPQIRSILQMILCDNNKMRPLTLVEFSLAAAMPQGSKVGTQQLDLRLSTTLKHCINMDRRVKSGLSGLLELRPPMCIPSESTTIPIPDGLTDDDCQLMKQHIHFSHRTAKEYIINRIRSDIFSPGLEVDNLMAGHLRLIGLYTLLARVKQNT